jgi:hypothetical protein
MFWKLSWYCTVMHAFKNLKLIHNSILDPDSHGSALIWVAGSGRTRDSSCKISNPSFWTGSGCGSTLNPCGSETLMFSTLLLISFVHHIATVCLIDLSRQLKCYVMVLSHFLHALIPVRWCFFLFFRVGLHLRFGQRTTATSNSSNRI